LLRRKAIIEMKRNAINQAELRFGEQLFEHTTDADYPEYHGFDGVMNIAFRKPASGV